MPGRGHPWRDRHHDWVCRDGARNPDVELTTGVPCAFGVLTVETME